MAEHLGAGRHTRLSSHWLSVGEDSVAGVAPARHHIANRSGGVQVATPGTRAAAAAARGSGEGGDGDTDADAAEEAAADAEAEGLALSDRRKEFHIIAFILTPAIVTTSVFLGLYWHDDSHLCRSPLRLWCLVEALRLAVSIFLSWVLQRDVERTPRGLALLDHVGRLVSMFSFFWFVLGHIWLVQGADSCSSHLFHLTAALIILQYTLMLLPLIVLLVLTPFLCLCLPCIIQGFLVFNRPEVKGASKKEINRLPTERFAADEFAEKGYDGQCAICIAEFEHLEVIRVLRCKHVFHKECVDEWLSLNGTCPICRAEISKALLPPAPRTQPPSTGSGTADRRDAHGHSDDDDVDVEAAGAEAAAQVVELVHLGGAQARAQGADFAVDSEGASAGEGAEDGAPVAHGAPMLTADDRDCFGVASDSDDDSLVEVALQVEDAPETEEEQGREQGQGLPPSQSHSHNSGHTNSNSRGLAVAMPLPRQPGGRWSLWPLTSSVFGARRVPAHRRRWLSASSASPSSFASPSLVSSSSSRLSLQRRRSSAAGTGLVPSSLEPSDREVAISDTGVNADVEEGPTTFSPLARA